MLTTVMGSQPLGDGVLSDLRARDKVLACWRSLTSFPELAAEWCPEPGDGERSASFLERWWPAGGDLRMRAQQLRKYCWSASCCLSHSCRRRRIPEDVTSPSCLSSRGRGGVAGVAIAARRLLAVVSRSGEAAAAWLRRPSTSAPSRRWRMPAEETSVSLTAWGRRREGVDGVAVAA